MTPCSEAQDVFFKRTHHDILQNENWHRLRERLPDRPMTAGTSVAAFAHNTHRHGRVVFQI